MTLSIATFYMISAAVSTGMAWRYLTRPGVSLYARRMLIGRHVSFIVLNVICQFYIFHDRELTIIDPDANRVGWIPTIEAIIFFAQGVFLSLPRLIEPGFLQTLWWYVSLRLSPAKRAQIEQLQLKSYRQNWEKIENMAIAAA